MTKVLKSITTIAGLALATATIVSPAMARQGADDPAGHIRQARGLDDPAGQVRQASSATDRSVSRSTDVRSTARQGADDPAGHIRRARGADDVMPHR
jgi:hypothetical protein